MLVGRDDPVAIEIDVFVSVDPQGAVLRRQCRLNIDPSDRRQCPKRRGARIGGCQPVCFELKIPVTHVTPSVLDIGDPGIGIFRGVVVVVRRIVIDDDLSDLGRVGERAIYACIFDDKNNNVVILENRGAAF